MKRILTIFSVCLMIAQLSAQTCTPDTNFKVSGFYPDQIAPAPVGVPYEAVLQFRLPKDTLVTFFGQRVTATIDSMVVLSVQGLPSEFTYACQTPACTFYPEQTGCGKISGTPLSSSAGTHPLQFFVRIYARVGFIAAAQDDTIRRFVLEVTGGTGTSRIAVNEAQIYPNPASNMARINAPAFNGGTYSVLTTQGRQVMYGAFQNDMLLDVSLLPPALYLLRLQDAQKSVLVKLLKE